MSPSKIPISRLDEKPATRVLHHKEVSVKKIKYTKTTHTNTYLITYTTRLVILQNKKQSIAKFIDAILVLISYGTKTILLHVFFHVVPSSADRVIPIKAYIRFFNRITRSSSTLSVCYSFTLDRAILIFNRISFRFD